MPACGSNTKRARVETTESRQCSVIESDRLADRQDAGSEQRARGHLSLAGPVAVIKREGHRKRRRQGGLMIHHTEAVPHRRIALARTLELPSRLRLEELVVTRPVLARADRPIGTHMAKIEIGPAGKRKSGGQEKGGSRR